MSKEKLKDELVTRLQIMSSLAHLLVIKIEDNNPDFSEFESSMKSLSELIERVKQNMKEYYKWQS